MGEGRGEGSKLRGGGQPEERCSSVFLEGLHESAGGDQWKHFRKQKKKKKKKKCTKEEVEEQERDEEPKKKWKRRKEE